MAHRIRCTFRPQAWVNHDQLIECSPLGPAEWITTVEALPAENSYESDNLRYTPEAPIWCREWIGPFEVDYEEVLDNEPSRSRYVHYFDMPVTGSLESEELQRKYGSWGSHPKYPAWDWKMEVASNDTRMDYWDWLKNKLDEDNE